MFYQSDIGTFKSALTPKQAVADAKEKGYKVAILADEKLTGALEFYHACKKEGIRPVIGVTKKLPQGHFVFLAKNHEGYKELCFFESEGYSEDIFKKDSIEAVLAFGEADSSVSFRYALRDAKNVPQNVVVLPFSIVNGKEKKDFYKVASLIAVVEKTTFEKVVAFGGFHFATAPYKKEVLKYKEAIADFLKNFGEYDFGHPVPPDYKFVFDTAKELGIGVPEDFRSAQNMLFRHLCAEGMKKRGLAGKKEYEERLAYEMDVISKMHFDGYMLIVWDFINQAKRMGIPVGPGRGSAAGSLVSYVLGITNLDPMKYTLLFERFLNPERVSLPDIDMDFCQDRREEIIEYVRQKYGEKNVAQIITISGIGAKAAIRDGARIIQAPLAVADKLAKSISDKPGAKLEEEEVDENALSPIERLIWRKALSLEGLHKNFGVHAAGVVISNDPLYKNAPVYEVNETKVVGFEGANLEDVNLVKYDFLGLKTLTVIDRVVKEIEEQTGVKIDINSIPPEDENVFKMISQGLTKGLFQIESDGMRELAMRLKPSNFEELIAMLALYRPGPMESGMLDSFIKRKHGQEKVSYFFASMEPVLKPILKPTYGLIVYQEQVIQIVQAIAGFSLGEADQVRRAMGKKKPEEMARISKEFVQRAAAKGYKESEAAEMFSLIEKFAGYGFNKSHSAAYAYITYQTAWLKYYYPVIFMASLINGEADKSIEASKLHEYATEAQKLGISVEAPDIFESGVYFKGIEKEKRIVFGLKAVKGVGKGAYAIEELKNAHPDITQKKDLKKFLEVSVEYKSDTYKKPGKRVIEALIKSGAMDGYGFTRKDLLDSVSEIASKGQIEKISGKEFSKAEKIIMEAEMLKMPFRSTFEKNVKPGTAILLKKEKRKKKNGRGEYIYVHLYVAEEKEGGVTFNIVEAADFNNVLESVEQGDTCTISLVYRGKYVNVASAKKEVASNINTSYTTKTPQKIPVTVFDESEPKNEKNENVIYDVFDIDGSLLMRMYV